MDCNWGWQLRILLQSLLSISKYNQLGLNCVSAFIRLLLEGEVWCCGPSLHI
jgi:hypothetical protein